MLRRSWGIGVGIAVLLVLAGGSATATIYEVGPGKPYARIVDVPMHLLAAGDIVRVYYQSTPYQEKFLLHGVGTPAAPIMLVGIPDAHGNKPILDGANAVSNEAYGNHYWNEDRQVILIGQYSDDPAFAKRSDYMIIDGFVIRNANRDNAYANDLGQPGTYTGNAAGIRSEYAHHLTIRNCEVYGNENGIFSSHTTDLTIEHTSVHDNGVGDPWSSQEHNLYLGGGRGSKVTVQYSRFGALLNDGQQCKFRAETVVFRYNWVDGGKNSQLDLVEDVENGRANAYVYGNVIIKPDIANNGRMIHFGGDITSNVRTGTLYFFNNTCIFQANRTGSLFQISSTGAEVVAENNIFVNDSIHYLLVWSKNANITGNYNWLSDTILLTEPFTNSIIGIDPGFISLKRPLRSLNCPPLCSSESAWWGSSH